MLKSRRSIPSKRRNESDRMNDGGLACVDVFKHIVGCLVGVLNVTLCPQDIDVSCSEEHEGTELCYVLDFSSDDLGIVAQWYVIFHSDGYVSVLDSWVMDESPANVDDARLLSSYEDAYIVMFDMIDDSDIEDAFEYITGFVPDYIDTILSDIDGFICSCAKTLHSCRQIRHNEDVMSAGITQCPSYVPAQGIIGSPYLAGDQGYVPTVPKGTDAKSMNGLKKHRLKGMGLSSKSSRKNERTRFLTKGRRFEADGDEDLSDINGVENKYENGMYYRFYSLLYGQRPLSELLKYPDVKSSVHDFEIFSYSPSGVKFALQEKVFLHKQDYAIINRIRSGFADVIVGYLVPESVKDSNTWEYAEISVGMEQDIKVTWRH